MRLVMLVTSTITLYYPAFSVVQVDGLEAGMINGEHAAQQAQHSIFRTAPTRHS